MIGYLRTVEASLSGEHGAFDLFGLFQRRRNTALGWDVVASAPWAYSGPRSVIELVIEDLKRVGGTPALLTISRVIALPSRRFVDAVHSVVHVEHGLETVGPGEYGNVEIARGYVITSRVPAAAAVPA